LSEIGQIGHDEGTQIVRRDNVVYVEDLVSVGDQVLQACPPGLAASSGNDYLFYTIVHNVSFSGMPVHEIMG
jgi:hypothetical protein